MDISAGYYLVVEFALPLVTLFIFLNWRMTKARSVVARAIRRPLAEVPLPFSDTKISEEQEKLYREAISYSAGKYMTALVTHSTVHDDHEFEKYPTTEKALDEAKFEFNELIGASRWYQLRLSKDPVVHAPLEQPAA